MATDLVAVLDSFSERFFRELDYGTEVREEEEGRERREGGKGWAAGG